MNDKIKYDMIKYDYTLRHTAADAGRRTRTSTQLTLRSVRAAVVGIQSTRCTVRYFHFILIDRHSTDHWWLETSIAFPIDYPLTSTNKGNQQTHSSAKRATRPSPASDNALPYQLHGCGGRPSDRAGAPPPCSSRRRPPTRTVDPTSEQVGLEGSGSR